MAPIMQLADVSNEYQKDLQLKREDVLSLMEWVKKQPHLPEILELQAILFLQSCYYSNEAAKICIDNYFTIRTISPEVFRFKSLSDPLMKKALDVAQISVLPKKTPEGYTVILLKLIDCSPHNYDFIYQSVYFGMSVMLHLHLDGCDKGLILLYDMQGGVLGHLSRINFVAMKQCIAYLQDAIPVRLVALHYINVISFMDKLMSLIKPFMKNELINMMHFHTNSIDTLFKFVPKDCLPDEYGGQAGTLANLHSKSKARMLANEQFLKWHDLQLVDETRREGKPKKLSDYFGIEGTFKKLDID